MPVIVVWPAGEAEREAALETLKQVLGAAADLDAFVTQLDRESADTGQDKPILRRALGQVFRQRDDTRRAIVQRTLAAELQPYDHQTLEDLAESHALLAEIDQRLGHWPRAIAQWQQAARLRALEPTGLFGLARAQIHERQFNEARQTLERLKSRDWPDRFQDVSEQISRLQRSIQEPPAD